MMLKKCRKCNLYLLKDICNCGEKTVNPHPAKFSLLDKHGKYRRAGHENKN